jgi:uncharacterized protein with von Willebrand factor type A (vWA) domain
VSADSARDTVHDFIALLRDSGLRIDLARAGTLFDALALIPARGLHAIFLAGRTTLCASPEEIARYDACFAQFFFGEAFSTVEILPDPDVMPMLAASQDLRRRDQADTDDDRDVEMGAASARELLRTRKLSKLSPEEHRLIEQLIARLRGKVAVSKGRRRMAAARGLVDIRRTVKAAQARGGEPDRLFHRIRRPRIRKRVLLLDISGSMAPFAPGLLRFGYAAYRCAPRRTEVFTIGTRLTRLSRCFDTEDAEAGNQNAARAVPDWSGGTRLGDQLKAFLDIWGQRGMARGAIVVIASDGWERGGADLLAEQMRRLRGLCHRVIWANPHKSTPGFEPLTRGMQAALPSVDDFVSGSSANELEALIRLMGNS